MNEASEFLLLLLAIGVIGWSARHVLLPAPTSDQERKPRPLLQVIKRLYFLLLGGFGVTSFGLLLLGSLDLLSPGPLAIAAGLFPALYAVKLLVKRLALPWNRLRAYAGFLLALGLLCLTFFAVAQPYKAVIEAQDASAFIGASQYMARNGGITYSDGVVAEMTRQERQAFFITHAEVPGKDETVRIRLQGGFTVSDGEEPRTRTGFFPLFPLWLALGNLFMGAHGYLYIMSLMAVLNLLTLFFLGHALGGRWTGGALVLVSALFFPQLYYLRLPMSETLLQLLLLGGLLPIMEALSEPSERGGNRRLLGGILWSAALFTKLELLVFMPLCLGMACIAIPSLRKRLDRWCGLLLPVAFCYLIVVHHQFESGNYLTQILVWCRDIDALYALLQFFNEDGTRRAVLFLLIWLVAALALRISRNRPRLAWWRSCVLILVLGGCFAVFFFAYVKLRFEPEKTVHLRIWFSYYVDLFAGLLYILGMLFFVPRMRGEPQAAAPLRLAFVFFAVPAAIYLIDPLVHPVHPFAIRRFVPLFFPLIMAFGFAGWMGLLQKRLPGRGLARILFAAMTIYIAVTCILGNKVLFRQPLYKDADKQVEQLIRALPHDGLVIVSDEIAGQALHMALQYQGDRDTLVMAVSDSDAADEQSAVRIGYLIRQLNQRPVHLVVEKNASAPALVNRAFDLAFIESAAVSFQCYKQRFTFSGAPEPIAYDYMIFRLRPLGHDARPESIDIGDAAVDLPFLRGGFYPPETDGERTYRWTTDKAVLSVPAAPELIIELCGGRPPDLEEATLRIEIDGQELLPPTLVAAQPHSIMLRIPPALREGRTELDLVIHSTTFSPADAGLGADTRQLGVMCFRVTALQKR